MVGNKLAIETVLKMLNFTAHFYNLLKENYLYQFLKFVQLDRIFHCSPIQGVFPPSIPSIVSGSTLILTRIKHLLKIRLPY